MCCVDRLRSPRTAVTRADRSKRLLSALMDSSLLCQCRVVRPDLREHLPMFSFILSSPLLRIEAHGTMHA
jgi:hypothetical protein